MTVLYPKQIIRSRNKKNAATTFQYHIVDVPLIHSHVFHSSINEKVSINIALIWKHGMKM